jgi:glutaredoxin
MGTPMTRPGIERSGTRVTLITRAGCHLCDDARSVVAGVCLPRGIPVDELDVDADPQLRAEYGDLVPVILVNGREHAHFRVEPGRLVRALGG